MGVYIVNLTFTLWICCNFDYMINFDFQNICLLKGVGPLFQEKSDFVLKYSKCVKKQKEFETHGRIFSWKLSPQWIFEKNIFSHILPIFVNFGLRGGVLRVEYFKNYKS